MWQQKLNWMLTIYNGGLLIVIQLCQWFVYQTLWDACGWNFFWIVKCEYMWYILSLAEALKCSVQFTMLSPPAILYFGGSSVWTQSLMVARQALWHLRCSTSPVLYIKVHSGAQWDCICWSVKQRCLLIWIHQTGWTKITPFVILCYWFGGCFI
jgi:hypothetical protein